LICLNFLKVIDILRIYYSRIILNLNCVSMEEKIFMARVAEQAERFEDMVDFLKPILKEKGGDFSVEERNLLSVGFKNLIGGKRTAIRTISAIE
jgi:hypothetical protein